MRPTPPSPPRIPPQKKKGSSLAENASMEINPEHAPSRRTVELATDQSIAARHLIYHPSEECINVIRHCAEGVNAIAARLITVDTDSPQSNLDKDEILISLCARLMNGDTSGKGGTAGIPNFRKDMEQLFILAAGEPYPTAAYSEATHILAEKCRAKLTQLTREAINPGPEGALARQGLLAFMGDLGGLEPHETGYGGAYTAPLAGSDTAAAAAAALKDEENIRVIEAVRADKGEAAAEAERLKIVLKAAKTADAIGAGRIYQSAVEGTCDAQRALRGYDSIASSVEVNGFKTKLEAARRATSVKGGILSAPTHTAGKKEERILVSFDVKERKGLLDAGTEAEERLRAVYEEHETTLVSAAWPEFVVSRELIQNVVEPVTGHVSGTFGEMAISMDLFCGTPPDYLSRVRLKGEPLHPEGNQAPAIGALAAAGLITAGFHTAVEIQQPLSTFCTEETIGGLGPAAVAETLAKVAALKYRKDHPDDPDAGQTFTWEYPKTIHGTDGKPGIQGETHNAQLSKTELHIPRKDLQSVIDGLEYFASKSQDMISLYQGGGTQATHDICQIMDSQSANPGATRELYSLQTRLEVLSYRGHTPELEQARALAELPVDKVQQRSMRRAIINAEKAADHYDLLRVTAVEIERIAVAAESKAARAEACVLKKERALEIATKAANNAAFVGGKVGVVPHSKEAGEIRETQSSLNLLVKARDEAYKKYSDVRIKAIVLRAEAIAIRKEAVTARLELTTAENEVTVAAKAELTASRAEAIAVRTEAIAIRAEEVSAAEADTARIDADIARIDADIARVKANEARESATHAKSAIQNKFNEIKAALQDTKKDQEVKTPGLSSP